VVQVAEERGLLLRLRLLLLPLAAERERLLPLLPRAEERERLLPLLPLAEERERLLPPPHHCLVEPHSLRRLVAPPLLGGQRKASTARGLCAWRRRRVSHRSRAALFAAPAHFKRH